MCNTRMGRNYFSGIVLCLVLVIFCTSICLSQLPMQAQHNSTLNVCAGIKHCSDCIKEHNLCAWCRDDKMFPRNFTRCDTYEKLYSSGKCSNITFPKSSVDIKENASLTDASESSNRRAVQITPQKIMVKLKVGQTVTVKVSVRQALDYPLDLYYLMDLSKSLSDDLISLRFLGKDLVRQLKRITTDLRLGFGTFVDKTSLPFVILDEETCHGTSCCPECVRPFSYRNVLPLTNNTRKFYEEVANARVSTNLDTVEGGFDALLQVATCKNAIGWRERARRMLVIVTDAGFHFAGDGKLAGVIRPNDGKCHMNLSNTDYNQSLEQDYPSIGQINEILQLNNIVPVFAVPDGKLTYLYRELARLISGAKVGILAPNSNNVITLVVRQFKAITSEIDMTDNAPENIGVSYTSHCTDGVTLPGSSKCTGLRLTETVSFDVKITGNDCTEGWKKQKFFIGPVGFDEKLTVLAKVICKCSCDRKSKRDLTRCSKGNGTTACGQCTCDPGYYGDQCQCSGTSDLDQYDVTACKRSNSTVLCHGRGQCICGECVCNKRLQVGERISGKYCECDNFSCDRHQGLLCGGEARGTCVCDLSSGKSKCKCKPQYTGDSCDCMTSTELCQTPSGLLCNGFGECKCGKCTCKSSSLHYGPTCEQCPACTGLCSSYRECVLCKVFDSGVLSPEQCQMCSFHIQIVENIANINASSLCLFRFDNNCTIHYGYDTNDDGRAVVYVQKLKVCRVVAVDMDIPKGAQWEWVIMASVVSVFAIGLIIIMLIRLYIYVMDALEYARFKKETSNLKWSTRGNPIFRSSVTTFVNPMHGKEDVNKNVL